MTETFLRRLSRAAQDRERAGLTRRLQPRAAGDLGSVGNRGSAGNPGSGSDAGSGVGELLDLAGNDYLGLAGDPRVRAGAAEAAQTWGAGVRASRLVTGTIQLHERLERALAEHCGQPAGLVFSTGYAANLGAVTALAGRGDLVVSDAHIHASLVDACRLSRARVVVTGHVDVEAVADVLAHRSEANAVVLAESVYSVLGDAAPLAELAEVCRRYDAVLIVDEAHALGTAGDRGRGLVTEAGLAGRPEVVVTGTLSKSLGSQGGFVLGHPLVREQLVNVARSFIYDTGLAPAAAGGALAALSVLRAEPERVDAVRRAAAALAAQAGGPPPAAAVLSIALPSAQAAVAATQVMAAAGVRVGCFRPPSVPDGISRLRLTARATLTDAELAVAGRALTAGLSAGLAAGHPSGPTAGLAAGLASGPTAGLTAGHPSGPAAGGDVTTPRARVG